MIRSGFFFQSRSKMVTKDPLQLSSRAPMRIWSCMPSRETRAAYLKYAFFTAVVFSSLFQRTLSRVLAFSDAFPKERSIGSMIVDLIGTQRDWAHPYVLLLYGGTLCIGLVNSVLSERVRDVVVRCASYVALTVSAISWFVFIFPFPHPLSISSLDARASTTMGRMLYADLVLLIFWQLYLIASERVPLECILTGPLGACTFTRECVIRASCLPRCILFIALLIPAIFRENGNRQSVADLFAVLNPLEVYAWIHVMMTSLYLIVMHTPIVRWRRSERHQSVSELSAAIAFVACANHNAAATWVLIDTSTFKYVTKK